MTEKPASSAGDRAGAPVSGSGAPSAASRVAALRDPATYPGCPARIDAVETHMAWVFMTAERAYKMKKPVRTAFLDFSTLEARRRDCEREVTLNRRLAGDVYRGTIPLTRRQGGGLVLGGHGAPVEWLVEMVRLPERRALSVQIERGTVDRGELRAAAVELARFYERSAPEPITASAYRRALADEILQSRHELSRAHYGLSLADVMRAGDAAIDVLKRWPELLNARARGGRIVDAHGDLRPEHIFLGPEPVIIDCLEFNRDLRILDPVSELAFLGLECERLGAPWIGPSVYDTYAALTGDRPPDRLIALYAAVHAYTRAKVAIWHLDDPATIDGDRFAAKAAWYVRRAAAGAARADAS